MKATGIIRKIDDLGRVVIPKEVRRTFELDTKDPVEIFTENDRIILKKYNPSCIFCEEIEGVQQFNGKNICPRCMEAIANEIDKH